MAHGEANRPLETKDGKPLDSSVEIGSKSLAVHDNRAVELLEQLIEVQKKCLLALEILINEEVK